MRPRIAATCGLVLLAACSAAPESGSAPDVSYRLERPFTGQPENALLFTYPEEAGYTFRLSSDDVQAADVDLDAAVPLQPRVGFTYAAAGQHSLDVEIIQPNGTPYLLETLSWDYSTVAPEPPIVSFSEKATADEAVTMLIAASRKAIDDEIWVEGDISGTPKWAPLADTNVYPLTVTPEDGLKSFVVKLRNVYGNESEPVAASILKKSTTPTGCRVEMDGAGSASRLIPMKLYGATDGELYYAAYGDVDTVLDPQPFVSGQTVNVRLSAGAGNKKVTIRISDLAGNHCDDLDQTIALSGDYVEEVMEIEGKPLWTTSGTVSLLLRYDHFASEGPIEMRLTGDITGAGIGGWQAYATTVPVTLSAGSGLKRVFAQFRGPDGDESFLVSAQVFRDPAATLVDLGAPNYNVVVSHVPGMSSVTITGCAETYTAVAYAATYACTLTGLAVHVRYDFTDGTTVTKSVAP